jgi:hypothetical protein
MTNGKHPHKSPTPPTQAKLEDRSTAAKATMSSAGTARPTGTKADGKHPARMA